MRRIYLFIIIVTALLMASSAASARPRKGFHTGPYILIEGGIMQDDFDHDEVSGTDEGRQFEPAIGFLFGWNVRDELSAEIQGRYSTNKNGGRREHIAGANLHVRWTPIIDALTDFESLRILPFLKAGISTRISDLPGAPSASNSNVTSVGFGPTVGGGIAFLWHKYFYFGADIQEDLLNFNEVDQTVNGVPNTLVYKGGFHPSFCAMGMVGVHY